MKLALDTVGDRLRFLRKVVLGVGRPKMAEWLGIPSSTLKHYEMGTRKVSAELLGAVAQCCFTHSYYDWLAHGDVERGVQVNPVKGTHNMQLLAKVLNALPATGPAILPGSLVIELRAVLPKPLEAA